MSEIILYKWRVFCTTDSKYEVTWRQEDDEPTTCPVNTAHTIDAGQNRIMHFRKPDIIKVKEEDTPTGGHYRLASIQFDAAPNTTTSHTVSFPFPVNAISGWFQVASENVGDVINMEVAPNTTVGNITADVSISDTVISVSQTVVDNIAIGYHVRLDDLTNQEDLGYVLAVDKNLNTITVQNASTQAFLATTPTFVQMTVSYVTDFEFGHPGQIEIGTSKIGTSHLPANAPIVSRYENKTSVTKRVVSYLEYLY